jgi:hypothetical protein
MTEAIKEKRIMPVSKAAPAPTMGKEIRAGLCSIYVSVSRPDGMLRVRTGNLEIGDREVDLEAGKSLITRNRARYDFHPLWSEIDATEREIRRLVKISSVNNLQRGTYMMPMLLLPEFYLKLDALIEKRYKYVDRLIDHWDTSVFPKIAEAYEKIQNGKAIYDDIKDRIAKPTRGQFEVAQESYPLSNLTTADMDLSKLTQEERRKILTKTNEATEQLFKNRMQALFDGVFGEIAKICDDIAKGGFDGNREKPGAYRDIMDALQRAHNFRQYADAGMLDKLDAATKTMQEITPEALAKNIGNTRAILKQAFVPLKGAVAELREAYVPGESRGARTAEF